MDAQKVIAHAVLAPAPDRIVAGKVIAHAVLAPTPDRIVAGKVIAHAVLAPEAVASQAPVIMIMT